LPLQPGFTKLVAAVAAPILRLLDDPPLVTSLVARDDSVRIFSYLTGFREPMASWSTETMGVFMLAPLVLVLAAPVGRWPLRIVAAVAVSAVAFAACVGIAVTQIQLVVEFFAAEQLGIAVHTAAEQARLERLNDILHATGMLALPAFLFLATYAYGLWLQPTEDESAGHSRGTGWRLGIVVPGVVAASALIVWIAMATVPDASVVPDDYHEGWAKLLRLNPEFVPAQVNVALHLESIGRLDEAIDLYRSALRTSPDRPEIHYDLGNALLEKRLYEQAVESYRETLRLAPGHAAAHRNLGLALGRLDRPCEAVRHLEQSARLPGSTESRARLRQEISRLRAACDE
jgi:hypothetical protein